MHGTKSFTGQFVRKFASHKHMMYNFSERGFVNKELYRFTKDILHKKIQTTDQLLPPLTHGFLQDVTFIYCDHFILERKRRYLLGNRCIFHHKMYTGESYKTNSHKNSYSICFTEKEHEHYGNISKLIDYQGKIFALVKEYEILDIKKILPKSNATFSSLINAKLFEKFYCLYNPSKFHYVIIDCEQIKTICLLVNNEKNYFFSKLVYEFEHD